MSELLVVFLSVMKHPSLRSLTVRFQSERARFSLINVPRDPLPSRAFQLPPNMMHLTEVHIHIGDSTLLFRHDVSALSTVLMPLASVHRLERLSLYGEKTDYRCNDGDIDLATRHWRGLRMFAVTFPVTGTPPSTPSAHSALLVERIAQGWPMLEILCLGRCTSSRRLRPTLIGRSAPCSAPVQYCVPGVDPRGSYRRSQELCGIPLCTISQYLACSPLGIQSECQRARTMGFMQGLERGVAPRATSVTAALLVARRS